MGNTLLKYYAFQGDRHYNSNNFLDAINYYKICNKMKLNDPEYLIKQGNCLRELKKFNKALTCYDKVLELDSNSLECYYRKGQCLSEMNRNEEALICYDKALQLKPECEVINNYKGCCLHKLKKYNEALSYYDKALKINPNFWIPLSNKGLCLSELKLYNEAIVCFNKAQMINPNNDMCYINKGICLKELKIFEDAINYFNKALKINPRNDYTLNNKGLCLYEIMRYEEALVCYNKALEINPKYSACFNNKGSCLYDMKLYNEALDCYNNALNLDPNYSICYYNKAMCLKQLKRNPEVIACFKKVLEIFGINEEKLEFIKETTTTSESKTDNFDDSHKTEIDLLQVEKYIENLVVSGGTENSCTSNPVSSDYTTAPSMKEDVEKTKKFLGLKRCSNIDLTYNSEVNEKTTFNNLDEFIKMYDAKYSEKSSIESHLNLIRSKLAKINTDFNRQMINEKTKEEFMNLSEKFKSESCLMIELTEEAKIKLKEKQNELDNLKFERFKLLEWIEKISDEKECVICLENPRQVIVAPCGHKVLCRLCYSKNLRSCPYCKRDIESCIEKILNVE